MSELNVQALSAAIGLLVLHFSVERYSILHHLGIPTSISVDEDVAMSK